MPTPLVEVGGLRILTRVTDIEGSGSVEVEPTDRRALARMRREEAGFTIVELMVALFILAVALFELAYTATAAFKYSAAARQRQQASNLANNAIEDVRALPLAAVTRGMSASDLAAGVAGTAPYSTRDPFVSADASCGSGYSIVPPGHASAECLKTTSGASANTSMTAPPLVRYWHDPAAPITVNPGTDFEEKVYVSIPGVTTGFRITVMIRPLTHTFGGDSWRSFSTIVPTTVGCLSTLTHPFSGPCNTFLFGTGMVPEGDITLTPGTTLSNGISGLTLRTASLATPSLLGTVQSEQVQLAQGSYVASGATLDVAEDASAPRTLGEAAISSSSDNDQGLPDLVWTQMIMSGANADTNTAGTVPGSWCWPIASCPSPPAADALPTGNPGVNQLVVSRSAADPTTNQSTSSVAPTATQSCGPALSLQTDGQPCTWVSGRQGGVLSMSVHLVSPVNGTDLGWCKLAEIDPPTADSSVFADRTKAPVENLSPDVKVTVKRALGQVTVGCIPSLVTPPTGWTRPANANGTGTLGYLLRSSAQFTQGGTVDVKAGAGYNIASPVNTFPNYGNPPAPALYYFNQTASGAGSYSTVAPTSPSAALATNPIPATGVPMGAGARGPGSLVYSPSAGTGSSAATGGPCTFTEQILPGGSAVKTGEAAVTGLPAASGTVTDAGVKFGPPLYGKVVFQAQCGGQTFVDLNLIVDLGTLSSTTKYSKAPS